MSRLPLLGFGLFVALGACAELRNGDGTPGTLSGACPADVHQDWVGQRIDVLNDVDLPEGTRVLFPTTPATTGFNEDRLNVTVDRSDMITRVYCG